MKNAKECPSPLRNIDCCKYATTIEDFLFIYIALKLKKIYYKKIQIYLPAIVMYFAMKLQELFLLNVHYMQEVLKI